MNRALSSPRRTPWRLITLAAVVLVVHAWLLASPLLPATDPKPAPMNPPALQTRTVVLAPVARTVPSATPPATPRPRTARPSRPTLAPTALTPPALTPPAQENPPPAPPPEPAQEPSDDTVAGAAPSPDAPDVVVASASTGSDTRPPSVTPFAPPPSAQLDYEVQVEYRGIPQSFKGTLAWQHDGERYRLHMAIGMAFLGTRVQLSEGRLGAHGLHPLRFSEKTRSERAAHFDEASGRIRYSANSPDAPLLPGHQDRLSVFFQLAGLVHARPERFAAGQSVHIPTSGTRDSETWTFEVKAVETIALPQGEVAALHLRRLPRKEFDTLVDLWLAPALGHLPVRMRITQANGDVADQRLITP